MSAIKETKSDSGAENENGKTQDKQFILKSQKRFHFETLKRKIYSSRG